MSDAKVVPYLGRQDVLLHPDTSDSWWGTEDESMSLAVDVLSRFEDPVLVDVGAAVGAWTLLAAVVPDLQVFAFEPQPLFVSLLRENVDLNGLSGQVSVYALALGAKAGYATLSMPGDASKRTLSTLGEAPGFRPGERHEVAVATLDEFFAPAGPTMVKVDAEGGELDVLDGARRTIEGFAPAFMVEVQTKRTKQFGYDAGEIVSWMEAAGYQFVTLDCRNRYFWRREEHRP